VSAAVGEGAALVAQLHSYLRANREQPGTASVPSSMPT
jgi:hypothetical protein